MSPLDAPNQSMAESQSSDILNYALGNFAAPTGALTSPSVHKTGNNASLVETQIGPVAESLSSADSSGSVPTYHFHGLAATQTQSQFPDDDQGEGSGSQKENTPTQILPTSISLPAAGNLTYVTPGRQKEFATPNSVKGNTAGLRQPLQKAPPPSVRGTKIVSFVSPVAPALPKETSVMRFRRRRSASPGSPDSFAGSMEHDADRYLATSRQFERPLHELEMGQSDSSHRYPASLGRRSTGAQTVPSIDSNIRTPVTPYSLSSTSQGIGKVLVENSDTSQGSSNNSGHNRLDESVYEHVVLSQQTTDPLPSNPSLSRQDLHEEPTQIIEESTQLEQEPTQPTQVSMSYSSGKRSPSPSLLEPSEPRSILNMVPPEKRKRYMRPDAILQPRRERVSESPSVRTNPHSITPHPASIGAQSVIMASSSPTKSARPLAEIEEEPTQIISASEFMDSARPVRRNFTPRIASLHPKNDTDEVIPATESDHGTALSREPYGATDDGDESRGPDVANVVSPVRVPPAHRFRAAPALTGHPSSASELEVDEHLVQRLRSPSKTPAASQTARNATPSRTRGPTKGRSPLIPATNQGTPSPVLPEANVLREEDADMEDAQPPARQFRPQPEVPPPAHPVQPPNPKADPPAEPSKKRLKRLGATPRSKPPSKASTELTDFSTPNEDEELGVDDGDDLTSEEMVAPARSRRPRKPSRKAQLETPKKARAPAAVSAPKRGANFKPAKKVVPKKEVVDEDTEEEGLEPAGEPAAPAPPPKYSRKGRTKGPAKAKNETKTKVPITPKSPPKRRLRELPGKPNTYRESSTERSEQEDAEDSGLSEPEFDIPEREEDQDTEIVDEEQLESDFEDPGPSRKRKRVSTPRPRGGPGGKRRGTAATPVPPSKRLRQGSTVKIEGATRVMAVWRDDAHYYSGIVFAPSKESATSYRVKFDDGGDGIADISVMRKCELRVGDEIFITHEEDPDVRARVVDASGWEEKRKVEVEVDGEDGTERQTVDSKDLRIPARTIDAMWKDRTLTSVVPARRPLKELATPSRLSTTRMSPAAPSITKIFAKTGFVITLGPGNNRWKKEKDGIVRMIKETSGSVIDDWSMMFNLQGKHTSAGKRWVIEKEDVKFNPKCGVDRAFLLADVHNMKPKFLIALALGIPCISFEWIDNCAKGVQSSWQAHLLAAGFSEPLNARISQMVDLDWGNAIHHLQDIMDNPVPHKLLADKSVLCLGNGFLPTKSDEPSESVPRIVLAMGASRVEAVQEVRFASQKNLDKFDYIVIQDKLPKPVQNKATYVDVPWIKQSLIAGRLLPLPTFTK